MVNEHGGDNDGSGVAMRRRENVEERRRREK